MMIFLAVYLYAVKIYFYTQNFEVLYRYLAWNKSGRGWQFPDKMTLRLEAYVYIY